MNQLSLLAEEHKMEYREDSWENGSVEDYGLSEFNLGQAEAYEYSMELIKNHLFVFKK